MPSLRLLRPPVVIVQFDHEAGVRRHVRRLVDMLKTEVSTACATSITDKRRFVLLSRRHAQISVPQDMLKLRKLCLSTLDRYQLRGGPTGLAR